MRTNFLNMKRLFLIIAFAALVLSSCSNKVDLYGDSSDTTVVYAMLDAGLDTNYIKITKSFIGNANELASNYDISNYKYDEIVVKLSGVFKGNNESQTVVLDTISKWIPYDGNATFYSGRYQTYYYTTEQLEEGEEYTISVTRKADGKKITAQTKTIKNFGFKKPLSTYKFAFNNVKRYTLEWKGNDVTTNFMTNAAYFEVTAYFHYKEQLPGQEVVQKSIKWALGSDKAENLFTNANNSSYYFMNFSPESLYTLLRNDEHLKNNSPAGVMRWYEYGDDNKTFEIRISAIGEELYNYYVISNSTSAIQDVPNYTNVTNGAGIVSSRYTVSSIHRIEQVSRAEIERLFPEYGFQHDPNP